MNVSGTGALSVCTNCARSEDVLPEKQPTSRMPCRWTASQHILHNASSSSSSYQPSILSEKLSARWRSTFLLAFRGPEKRNDLSCLFRSVQIDYGLENLRCGNAARERVRGQCIYSNADVPE